MKHINEVDVSAWRRSDNEQESQIEELEASLDGNHHVRYRRFYMRFCDGDVWFRFRLPSQFDAHGASTIQTLVFTSRRDSDPPIFLINHRQEWRAKDTQSSQELRLEEPVDVPNQECCDFNRMLQPLPPGFSLTDNKALLAHSENKTPKLPSIVRVIFRLRTACGWAKGILIALHVEINTSRGSSLEPSETNSQPTPDPGRERSVVPSPITDTRNPVIQDQTPTELQMTEVSSNAMTAPLQEDTVARHSDDQDLHTAPTLATSTGVPSIRHARSNQCSQRKPAGVFLDLTGDDDDVTVKHEVKRKPKVKAEEQRLGIPQAITNVDSLENKSKAALLEELQDVEMSEARTRLEEQKLLLRQKRVLLERQLKKKNQTGTPEKPVKIEDD